MRTMQWFRHHAPAIIGVMQAAKLILLFCAIVAAVTAPVIYFSGERCQLYPLDQAKLCATAGFVRTKGATVRK